MADINGSANINGGNGENANGVENKGENNSGNNPLFKIWNNLLQLVSSVMPYWIPMHINKTIIIGLGILVSLLIILFPFVV